jgi:hypothetical protein
VVVELLYFDGCPNWLEVRALLDRLIEEEDLDAKTALIRIADDSEAANERFLGSPSVRVDGRDVEVGAEARSDYGMQCRIYRTSAGLRGVPDEAWIRSALQASR